jgi:hypothetical protein
MYDVQSIGAKSYLAVAQELMRRSEQADRDEPHRPNTTPREVGEVSA